MQVPSLTAATVLLIATVGIILVAALAIPSCCSRPHHDRSAGGNGPVVALFGGNRVSDYFRTPCPAILFAVGLACLFLIPGVGGALTAVGVTHFRRITSFRSASSGLFRLASIEGTGRPDDLSRGAEVVGVRRGVPLTSRRHGALAA
ncbi:hypothetical protein ACFFQF_15580 [Haladaptatus pallidirubidus]|uniref:hypothetical protein n=1 Tax=Haladaptatus pallidirubidus TaxID=1008152 RepID=UPI0035EF6B8F